MRKATEGYVKTKISKPGTLFQLVEVYCIPLYQTRVRDDGEIESKFFLISGDNPEREIWLTRDQIY